MAVVFIYKTTPLLFMEEVYVLIIISNQMVEQIPKKEKAIKRVYCLYCKSRIKKSTCTEF